MEEDIRKIRSGFYNTANDIFQASCQAFRHNVSRIDRDGNENVHQLIRSKYAYRLRRSLEHEAGILIERYRATGRPHELKTALTETILFFCNEFMRKTDES